MTSAHLHLVDAETGEVAQDCPKCLELQREIHKKTFEARSWHRKYLNAVEDSETTARNHVLWPDALAIFRYWQELTGHANSRFTADRFWMVEPFLSTEGAAACRQAVRGLVESDYHMKRGAHTRRDGATYDDFWRVFKARLAAKPSQDTFEHFRDRGSAQGTSIRGVTLLAHAREIAQRVLERARLIESCEDPIPIGHLLLEIDRLTREWLDVPNHPDQRDAAIQGRTQGATGEGKLV